MFIFLNPKTLSGLRCAIFWYYRRYSKPGPSATASMAQRRLNQLLTELSPAPQTIGTIKVGEISYEVPESFHPSRLPHVAENALLDIEDSFNLDNLQFMLQKYLLGQDIFLLSQPGLYARRLAMTFCR